MIEEELSIVTANKVAHKNRSGKKTANRKREANKTANFVKWGRGKREANGK